MLDQLEIPFNSLNQKNMPINAKWRTPYNSKEMEKKYEVNDLPSKTIPDQSLSVKEILTRYAQGLPTGGQKIPVYHGEENDMPDLNRLDLSERYDLLEANQQRIKNMQRDLLKQGIELEKQEKIRLAKLAEEEKAKSAALSAGASASQ